VFRFDPVKHTHAKRLQLMLIFPDFTFKGWFRVLDIGPVCYLSVKTDFKTLHPVVPVVGL